MIALIVTINIKAGFKEQFMESMMGDAIGSNNDEPGCLRFDVLQDTEHENRIHLFEVYQDEAAVDAHRAAPHYTKWRLRGGRLVRRRDNSQRGDAGLPGPGEVGKAASRGLAD